MRLIDLTLLYVKYFNKKNLENIISLFADDSRLKDPENIFVGSSNIKKELAHLFSFDNLFLQVKNIIANDEENFSVIEFSITVGDTRAEGVDIIEWNAGKIKSLSAYVNDSKERNVHGEM